MITVSPFLETHRADIEKFYAEACTLLPELPDDITFQDNNNLIIPGYPTGGFTASPSLVKLGVDSNWPDASELAAGLRATILHEAYHVVQGYSGEASKKHPFSAIESAVYEGCATVFARQYAGKTPGWAQYEDEQTMLSWFKELCGVADGQDYKNLRFFDPATGRRWVVYKTGVFIVDRALQMSGLDITELRLKSINEVLELARLK